MLNLFEDVVKNIKNDLFEQVRDSMLLALREKDLSLENRADRYWYEIDNDYYRFDQKEIRKEVLNSLKREDLLLFYQNLLRHIKAKLSIQFYNQEVGSFPNETLNPGSSVGNQEQVRIDSYQNITTFQRFPPQINIKQVEIS